MKAREHYGFEYTGAKDPSRMVSTSKLTEDEVLGCLLKILKGVSVVLHRVDEYSAVNPPQAVSFPLIYVFVSLFLTSFFRCGF